jgi:hypothetical protein
LLLGLSVPVFILMIWAAYVAMERRDEEAYFERWGEHRDTAAARVQAENAKSEAARSAAFESMSETERNCLGMYLKYNDVPASKLTMSQIRQIEACQGLGLYHELR